MTLKPRSSLDFRRMTPGMRLGSVYAQSRFRGQLYSFQYASWGDKKTKNKNKDRYPVLLLAYKEPGGTKVWLAKNGKRLIYGFNLNYLPIQERIRIVRKMKLEMDPDDEYSYQDLKAALKLPISPSTTIFRKYDVRGGRLRYLKQIDLDTYASYLEDRYLDESYDENK